MAAYVGRCEWVYFPALLLSPLSYCSAFRTLLMLQRPPPVFCHACCQATLIGEDIEVEGGGDDLNEVGGHHENSGEG